MPAGDAQHPGIGRVQGDLIVVNAGDGSGNPVAIDKAQMGQRFQWFQGASAVEDHMADPGGFEIDRCGEIRALPNRPGTLLDADKRAVQLVAIGETQQIRSTGGGENGHGKPPGNENGADHFS